MNKCYCGFTVQNEEIFKSLFCQGCQASFHSDCLKTNNFTSLKGDIFFDFTCSRCGKNGYENYVRQKLSWLQVVVLALYNMQLNHSEDLKGYFKRKEHICRFIDARWKDFFCTSVEKTSKWHGIVSGTLLSWDGVYFKSGTKEFNQMRWWKLEDGVVPSYNLSELHRLSKGNQNLKRKHTFHDGSEPAGGKTTGLLKSFKADVINVAKVENNGDDDDEVISVVGSVYSDISCDGYSCNLDDDEDSKNPKKHIAERISRNEQDLSSNYDSKESDKDDSNCVYDLDDVLISKLSHRFKDRRMLDVSSDEFVDEDEKLRHTTDISLQDVTGRLTLKKLNVMRREENDVEANVMGKNKYVLMSEYEENVLLERIHRINSFGCKNPEFKRLRAKLMLRKTQRDLDLPVFDVDKIVKRNLGLEFIDKQEISVDKLTITNESASRDKIDEVRVLDRYLEFFSHEARHEFDQSDGRLNQSSFVNCLVGQDALLPIHSPYTGRILKPYIWRDCNCRPLKLKLLEEIVAHHQRRKNNNWKPDDSSPIDYSYVRPQHIASVNDYCRRFFWPGIDLTESLEYPDFSCVALYKKMVIGFAFMVPDVSFDETYISFIFTHPEWRNAGIATFMLYHLMQTCQESDVILHVSVNNPALLLYQKFGFKEEEFVIGFYDKYLPHSSKDCRNALLLRFKR